MLSEKQILKVLKDRTDLEGAARDICAKLSTLNVKIIKVKDYPSPRYIDNHDGTVLDTWNNFYLVTLPHTDLPNHFKGEMPWEEGKAACADLNFAGHKGWFLHSPQLGFSLVKNNPTGPQIDTSIFKDTKEAGYWTNEEVAWNKSYVRIVGYDGGYVGCDNRDDEYYVRPVRPASV